MTTQVTNYQCPTCTGPLHFVGASGQLECEYCGSSFDVAEIEELYAKKEAEATEATKNEEQKSKASDEGESQWDVSGLNEKWDSTADKMKTYSCPSCGAELICDDTTAATSCPYCGNPSIVPGQFAGVIRPDYVLPFKLSKDDAIKALKKHYKKKPLLPKSFSEANHLDEIKGIYVPFWMFDGEAEGSVSFNATRSHSHVSGGYKITVTEHFDVKRSGKLAFEKVPVDASAKMPDDYMDSIEPYDYSELKQFSTAYLPGFLADKYDVTVEDSYERVDKRFKGSFADKLANTVIGYNSCVQRDADIRLKRGKVHYALLPVWLLNTKWKGKNFLFAMNGQTGKFVGDLPISVKRAIGLYASVAAPLIAIGVAAVLMLMK